MIVGALVHELQSFSQAMIVNGACTVGAALLMLGLAVWERRDRKRREAEEHSDEQEEEEVNHHAVAAIQSQREANGASHHEQPDVGRSTRRVGTGRHRAAAASNVKDVELV